MDEPEKCEYCGSTEDVIEDVADPYNEDVHNDDTLHTLCAVCIHERSQEI